MNYGLMTPEMIDAITPFVKGKTVVDLGAGFCLKSRFLKELGASRVIAVDKIDMPKLEGIERIVGLFSDADEQLPFEIDVAFVSWPQNYNVPGLVEIIERCKILIYIGNNFDGNRCGFPKLFVHMLSRTLLHDISLKSNSLVIVGEPLEDHRAPTVEEKAALTLELTPFPS